MRLTLQSNDCRQFPPLEDLCELSVGFNTGSDQRWNMVASHQLDLRYHRCVRGTGISRYGSVRTDGWIIYDREFVRSLGRTVERFVRNTTLPTIRY